MAERVNLRDGNSQNAVANQSPHLCSHLARKVWGEPMDVEQREAGIDVKGVTCTNHTVGRNIHHNGAAQSVIDVLG